MAASEGLNNPPGADGRQQHQRSKSSVLRSFIGHKRNLTAETNLAPSTTAPLPYPVPSTAPDLGLESQQLAFDMGLPGFSRQPQPLEEVQQNNQHEQFPTRSPRKSRDDSQRSSPTKSGFAATISLRTLGMKDSTKLAKAKDASDTKPKKAKSATNLAGLLSRPKSSKNLKQQKAEDEARAAKDKENRTPPSSVTNDMGPPPPIYAQFARAPYMGQDRQDSVSLQLPSPTTDSYDGFVPKQRPKSYQPYSTNRQDSGYQGSTSTRASSDASNKRQSWANGVKLTRPPLRSAFPGSGDRTMSSSLAAEPFIDPKDVDTYLEAMLDRRNIPENQRYKMRNLNNTIKLEFIRQDWAETHAKLERSATHESEHSEGAGAGAQGSDDKDDGKKKKKHTRGRSLTLKRNKNKDPSKAESRSPSKKREGTLGRHFRGRSTDSVASERPSTSSAQSPSLNTGIFAIVKGYQGPGDYVAYLRKVQKPEAVEVGKLHKLRLLLRNETVAWTEEFIRQGGMKETVDLLHRIMEVEWREEHEDALLHENLLCLKALCTTALALQYLHSIHTALFPALLHMIFDPDKKGPSEFTTRSIITSILLKYIECATPQERVSRAAAVLRYLRDPEPKEEERPVSFVLEMRRERPYRMWCKEVVNVTKEVFWIFLHNLNIVALPSADKSGSNSAAAATNGTPARPPAPADGTPKPPSNDPDGQFAYMARHFPQERPPVPAAPYVGGVEWDATNYLASHLDLLNAILACSGPTAAARNALREQLRISGWERCMGASLRMCKEKFYGAVHDGLRVWVRAAADDGWDVRDVRYGPPPEERTKSRSASPAKKAAAPGGRKKENEAPPKLEMPKLDLALNSGKGRDPMARASEPWLS